MGRVTMEIKNCALKIASRHETRDPIRIAKELGFVLIFTPLVDIRGYYQYLKRCHVIYINNELDEYNRRFVCAHELGHFFLHRHMNRIFMDTRTQFVTSRYEREADKFAVDLIFDDYELQDYLDESLPSIAQSLGISYELAEYRMSTVQPSFYF